MWEEWSTENVCGVVELRWLCCEMVWEASLVGVECGWYAGGVLGSCGGLVLRTGVWLIEVWEQAVFVKL